MKSGGPKYDNMCQAQGNQSKNNSNSTMHARKVLCTLTAVATTEPLGGFSLYLGVPAMKITIAMAGKRRSEDDT